jgi:hypothetical protein
MNDAFKDREQISSQSLEVPSYTVELGTRISATIDELGGLRAAAPHAGASEDTLANWRDGKARPSFFGILGLANAAKIRIEWLASGSGPMRIDEAPPAPAALPPTAAPPLDEALMGRLVDGITAVYKELGQVVAPVHLGMMAARLHNDIAAIADGPEDYPGAVKMRLAQLRRELQAAAVGQTSSKRSA